MDIEEVLKEEQDAKELAYIEMEVTKGENLLKHHDEIKSRPRREWIDKETEKGSGQKAVDSVQKLRDKLKRKQASGNLSNKDRKKLDSHADRTAGKVGMKLTEEWGPKAGGERRAPRAGGEAVEAVEVERVERRKRWERGRGGRGGRGGEGGERWRRERGESAEGEWRGKRERRVTRAGGKTRIRDGKRR